MTAEDVKKMNYTLSIYHNLKNELDGLIQVQKNNKIPVLYYGEVSYDAVRLSNWIDKNDYDKILNSANKAIQDKIINLTQKIETISVIIDNLPKEYIK